MAFGSCLGGAGLEDSRADLLCGSSFDLDFSTFESPSAFRLGIMSSDGNEWEQELQRLLAACLGPVSSLYFHIGETEKKCFIEEIPDETMVIGNYRTQLYDKQREEYLPATPGLGMLVEVKDPDDKVILSRQYGSEGRFIFTSHTPGEHQICLHSNSTKFSLFAGGMLRVHLDIQVGEHTNDYAQIAAKDKLSELQLRVRQLIEQVEQIQKEQNYQRWREERFRQTSESTNQRVLWWSIAQTLILVAIGIWQMRHLKSFFEAKKLV